MKPVKDICRMCNGIDGPSSRGSTTFEQEWHMHNRVWCQCCYAESVDLSGTFEGGFIDVRDDIPLACAFIAEQAVSQ